SNQLLSLQELFALGRPLWGAALNNDANIKDLLKLAEQKLLGGGITVDNWIKKPTLSSALAVLSSRISLDITAESRIASELVAGFMGICVHVSEDRCRLLVFYPSEPIVAEAAASLMQHEIVFRKLLNFLLDALHTGYVEPGYRGELVARLLLMIAWDQATGSRGLLSSSMSSHLENLGYMREFVSQPIRVKDFLTSLFGQDNYNDHIQDLPQKFADGLLAFTHFIPLTYTPTQIELKSLFIRYAAVICKRNQAGVDLILPVLKLSKEYVFKGRITEGKGNPYLSLYLQLGAPISELRPLHVNNLPSSNTRSKKRARLEEYGEQYCLSAFGLDKSVYHCLDKWSDNDIGILKQLLHAWPDPVNLTTHEDVKLLIQSMMPLVYQEDGI
ncbi:3041_t:CDS:2, partial [Funneliformis geosporum]